MTPPSSGPLTPPPTLLLSPPNLVPPCVHAGWRAMCSSAAPTVCTSLTWPRRGLSWSWRRASSWPSRTHRQMTSWPTRTGLRLSSLPLHFPTLSPGSLSPPSCAPAHRMPSYAPIRPSLAPTYEPQLVLNPFPRAHRISSPSPPAPMARGLCSSLPRWTVWGRCGGTAEIRGRSLSSRFWDPR